MAAIRKKKKKKIKCRYCAKQSIRRSIKYERRRRIDEYPKKILGQIGRKCEKGETGRKPVPAIQQLGDGKEEDEEAHVENEQEKGQKSRKRVAICRYF